MFRNRFSRVVMLLGMMVGVFTFPSRSARAQDYVPLNMDDLENLAGPVALYPDAVLAQLLTACTYPADVVAAAQWLDAGNNPDTVDSQPWDDSVKGMVRFPDILHYMASNADWMNAIGDAFLNQQSDLMTAVQNLRAEAYADGNLVSNEDQQVIEDGNIIQIIPANPDTIYIPVYDPTVIYVARPYVAGRPWPSLLRFDQGYRVGAWLNHDLDWIDHRVYVGNWGANRPWWHPDVRGGHPVIDYHNVRPGDFHPTGNIKSGAWQRDAHRPPPLAPRAPVRTPDRRPGTGYPPPARPVEHAPEHPAPEHPAARPEPPRPAPEAPVVVRGSEAARDSQRGTESRARANPAPARPEPTARPAPQRAAPPPPAARPSEPTRGGAAGGYQSGAEAARSSARGSASRAGAGRK